jgi:hypothetical protein
LEIFSKVITLITKVSSVARKRHFLEIRGFWQIAGRGILFGALSLKTLLLQFFFFTFINLVGGARNTRESQLEELLQESRLLTNSQFIISRSRGSFWGSAIYLSLENEESTFS